MDWKWINDQGLTPDTDPYYYARGEASPDEVAHAVETAYNNTTANSDQRKQLVDMLWETGAFTGNKEAWYTDDEPVSDLANAAKGMAFGGEEGLKNVGGEPQVWSVGGENYIVHVTTGLDGSPIRAAWLIEDQEQLQSYFGPGQPIVFNATMGSMPMDVLGMGNATELANLTDDPIQTWIDQLEVESKTQPWLLDSDYQALTLEAVLENRPLSQGEIALTDWWQENTGPQRAWMKLFHGDPMSAQQQIDDGRIAARTALEAAGVANPPDSVINFMADQGTMGNWSQAYFQNQLRAVSDPSSGVAVDAELSALYNSGELDTTQKGELEVRSLYKQWLGPGFGEIDDTVAAEWAGKLRNDPDAVVALTENLKDQKEALFSGYDREMSYEAIVSPWRQFVSNQWGQTADENDPLFHSIVNMNDASEAGKVLTREGLKRDNQTVKNRVHGDMISAFGGTAR